jgi:ABC-type sugar transport system ATPase subunit
VRFEGITKRFAGVVALEGVSLAVRRGECHGLMGENGAGKSTLGKILAGIYRPDEGQIELDGEAVALHSPAEAQRAGVGMVHQELAFCPDLSVAENLCMGVYPRRLGCLLDRREMHRRATALLGRIGVALAVDQPMRQLSTAREQLVQIASAVGTGARILIFDEPTSSLSEPEAQRLFALIEQLKAEGVTILYISHRMPEVFRLCDRFSVLRDGRHVGMLERGASEDQVVRLMIGRSLERSVPKHLAGPRGQAVLRVRGLSSPGKFREVSFEVRRGEIVGFAGLVGSGRSEIAAALFGLDRAARGEVEMEGRRLALGSVRRSMGRGIGLVPEDRKRQGLVLSMSGRANFSLAMLGRLSRWGFVNQRAERREAREFFQKLAVKTPSIEAPVAGLSGGNQQKIVLARWLARGARLLIVDEPTRGVDVGAKAVIHGLLDDLACQGVAILLISSELPEVIKLSTRILVLREGRLAGELSREQANAEAVLKLMAGVGEDAFR